MEANELNNYINNLDILNEFTLYFSSEAEKIIQEAEKEPILLKNKDKDFVLFSEKEALALTKREMDCLNWYLQGKKSGEIAMILGISRRTVESYVENIKSKWGYSNLFQLGYYFSKMLHSK